jgi:hypothetical protein
MTPEWRRPIIVNCAWRKAAGLMTAVAAHRLKNCSWANQKGMRLRVTTAAWERTAGSWMNGIVLAMARSWATWRSTSSDAPSARSPSTSVRASA